MLLDCLLLFWLMVENQQSLDSQSHYLFVDLKHLGFYTISSMENLKGPMFFCGKNIHMLPELAKIQMYKHGVCVVDPLVNAAQSQVTCDNFN